MGLTALILGIISVLMSLIPLCNYVGLVPAVVGIVFGIVSLAQIDKSEFNGNALAITGIVFCILAVMMSVVWTVLLLVL